MNTINTIKALPHDLQAEKGVIGAIIQDSKALSVAASSLEPDSFYKIAHQKMFKLIIDASDAGKRIDPAMFVGELKKAGMFEKIGGRGYLQEIVDACPITENVDYHVNITKEMAIRRMLITKTAQIQEAAYNQTAELDELTNELTNLKNTSIMHDQILRVSDFISAADKRLAGESNDFIPTGNEAYDNHFGGFELGEYIVLSGFSGMGKTSYMNQCLVGALVESNVSVGVFSSEISGARLLINLARPMSGEYIHTRRDGTMSKKAKEAWEGAKDVMKSDEFTYYLNDTASIYIEDLHRLTRKMVEEKGVKIIGIDHLQRLRTRQNHTSEALRMKEISNRACEMAREFDITILMLSQKTKGDGGRFQLRYATETFSDADKVLDLSQASECELEDEPLLCERILAEKKGRNYGTVKLRGKFYKPGLHFSDWCQNY